ncbi:hemagglutinin repeat-containing protein [Variovorax paradoxus]|uniref:Filamentous hemagglutinin family outer membrane protein n=1 Tax=Variovorax paradoxus (strain EPS) TaxID=595537 RepID=E6V3Y7_VARPE|nr:hemagglutinin repeat-containing protein [Variovorax paradoxus]ADU38106.1 filamentous hemagglutinin family outer membrane protein [Variovorax paradoxus EPS]
MNRHLHRIVFNAARGMRMVVQETATSTGKGKSKATGGSSGAASAAVVALFGLLAALPGQAQIVGAPNVPGNLRPTVLVAPNGVPLINIQSPSAAGVSRNIYNQLNVGPNGAIFNNSRTNVQTQLGGIVQGNPFLATGPARIILNEVNGGNVSQLRGYMEVAGQRAEIIIANPAGINVDGAGFINASRATLTTGTPQLNAFGGLDSFLVRGGTVTINGAGLDASKTDYAAILARAVEANAGIWASELKVVTGANQVSADHSQISPTAGTGAAPTFALDVAALGGMYAGKIVLVGTEAGLGVRNAGTIQAAPGTPALAGAGQLVVTSAGRLENIGTIQAMADANLAASNLANSGRISTGGNLKIATQETLGNSFNGAGGTLEGARVELASTAGNIDNRNGGTIRQTSSAALAISAPALSNTGGGVIGLEPVPETPSQPGGGTSGTGTGGGIATPGTPAAGSGTGSGGTITPAPYVPPSPGTLTAAGTILNDGGRIYAGGPITLQSANISNNGGTLSLASITVNQPTFDNRGGTLNISNGFSANVGSFDNTGGKLNAGTLNIASSGDLVNTDGTLSSAGDASLAVGGKADNTRGTISAMGALTAKVAGATNNTSGTLVSNQGLTLNGGSLDNTKGSIQSAQAGAQLMVTNQLVNGSGGAIGAATDLNVQAGELTNGGSLRGADDLGVAVGGAMTNDGSVTAGRNTTITAASLQSSSAGVLGAGVQNDGKLGAAGNLRVTTSGTLVASGYNIAAGNVALQGASVDLSASETNAANIAITATQGNVVTGSKAKVITPGTLSVTADGQSDQTLVNDAGTLNAGLLDLNASNIANTNGGEIVQTGTGASTIATSGTLNNDGGRIASNGQDLSLRGAVITNTGGRIEHAGAGTLGIAGGSYNAIDGQVTTNKTLTVAMSGAFGQDGAKARVSADRITLDAGALGNRGGQIVQTGADATRITVVGAIDNTAGTLASNGNTNIAAGSLLNQGGTVRAAETSNLDIDVKGQLDNSSKGVIGAGGSATVKALGLNNDKLGNLTASGDLTVDVRDAATNDGGTLAANGNTTLKAGTLDNSLGTVAAVKGHLSVTTTGTTTNAQGTLQAGAKVVLVNAGLVNTGGKVFGGSLSVDTQKNALDNNQGGTLAANSTVDVKSGALNNDAGLIQSGGAMTIDTDGKKLTNTNAASYTTKQGGITSADTLTLKNVGELDNKAGFIGAKNALDASTRAFTNTGGGQVLGQSTVTLDTHGAAYDNTGGETLAVGNLGVNAGTLTNTKGLIRSAATTTLSAASLVNSDTREAEQGIEGQNVDIAAQSILNKSGAIRADQNTTLSSNGTIDNSAGLVSAGKVLTVKDPAVAKTLSVLNTGGTLVGGENVVLDAGSVSWDGKLLSLQDMTLMVTRDIAFAVGSETVANRNLTISTTGDITNSGKLAAGNDLTLSARDINNKATGDIQGKTTTLNASGTLTNRGVIDGGTTRINATTLDNLGTGRIYGDWVAIGAGTLNNGAETVNGVASAGTIAAREHLDIGAGTINNRDGALILSAGNLYVGGKLVDGKASGAASVLNNHAATIEAVQDMDIKANVLNNTNGGVTWTTQTTSDGKQHTEYALPGSSTRYDPSQLVFVTVQGPSVDFEHLMGYLWPSFVSYAAGPVSGQFSGILVPSASYPLSRYGTYYANPPRNSSDLHGTRQINIDFSEDFTEPGAWYSRTDPIWAAFGVTPPATDLPTNDAQLAAYLEAHKRLDASTEAFIRDVYANYARSYYAWAYTESTTTPVLQTSSPARIIAGGKMNIAVGSGTNDMSQILAGGALTVTAGTITNKNVEVSGAQTRTGVQLFQAGLGNGEQISPYNTSVPITVTLAAARQEGKVSVAGSGGSTGTLTPGHTNQGVTGPSDVNASGPTGVAGETGTPVNASGTVSGGATGPIVHPIFEVHLAASSGSTQVVRATLPSLTVPSASLFRTHAEASSHYLIETDPRFANQRNWLSSDYLLNNLGQDPNNTLKRLGDGFYEQRLIREQVAQLTGYRYLDGYDSDDKQYAALMDAGLTFARQYALRPGIALTPAQMAQLTSDIVWLVEQTVTLPDGSTQRVLVPQVYARVKNGDVDGSGALLAGKEVNLKLDGDLVNSGTVAGRRTVSITAENIQNLNGRISGSSLDLKARTDLNNIGGTIDAASQLKIEAGRDINVRTTTSSSGLALDLTPGAVSLRGATIVDRVAGLYVTGSKGVLVASAGRDVNLIGALVANSGKEGTTEIGAGRDINLGTVTTARQDATVRDVGNYRAEASTQEVGTRVEASGDIRLRAQRDVNARAATIDSTDGALEVIAKRDINIVEGRSGTALNAGLQTSDHGFGGSESRKDQGTFGSTDVIGSSLGGKTVVLDAGNDIRIRGSNVVSDKGTELQAGNNITIEAATQSRDSQYVREESNSGIFDGGSGWTWGRQDMRSTSKHDESTAVGSTVGAISGNVTITAGNRYSQVGSDVTAPDGNIDIQARDVQIVEARESSRSESTHSFSQSGITLGFKAPLIDMLRGMEDTAEAMGNTKDDRMKALGAASIGLSGFSAYQDIAQQAATQSPDGTGAVKMGATLTIGSSSSESSRKESSDTSARSRVQAGGNVSIVATGGGRDSNILVRGSQIDAGKNVSLAADNNVTLEAAANTKKESSTSRSSNASIGVGVAFGETNGITLEVAAASQSGRDSGTDGAWTNTTVKAGQQVSIQSGGDTTVRGAIVSGKRVEANVGGNLRIETLQDTSTYHSENSGGGFSGSFCIYACYGGSVSVSANNMRGDGDFASATQQSGFFAGDGGFGVSVRGNTTLIGAAISSKDAAVDEGKNSFNTASLTMTDLVNRDTFKGSGYSFNISTSGGGGAGIGDSDVDRSSTTRSGISGIAGNTAIRTGVDGTNALQMTNRQRAMRDIQAQVLITSQFGSQASRAVGDYAEEQYRTLMRQANAMGPSPERDAMVAEATKWGESGVYRVAAHLVVGGLAGGAGGAAGAGAVAAGAQSLNDLQNSMLDSLIGAGLSPSAARGAASTLGAGFASVIGALAGGAAGAASAYNTDANNRILHPSDTVNAHMLAAQSGGKYSAEEIAQALRWSGVRDASGNVATPSGSWQSYDSATGQAYSSQSPTRTVAGDMVYDPGLRVVANGYALQETPPGAPTRELMNFIVQGTGGARSPYVFDTTGMTYGPTNSSDNPQYFPCASTTCLVYGANWNPNNPTNQAQAEQGRNAVGAVGLIVGAPLVAAYGVPVLMGAGVTAQTIPLTGGVASVAAGKWLGTAGVGFGMGAGFEFVLHNDTMTPSSLFWSGVGGSVGGGVKLSANAYLGLANQWVPTTTANFLTWFAGSQVAGRATRIGTGAASDALTNERSWWNTPINCNNVSGKC